MKLQLNIGPSLLVKLYQRPRFGKWIKLETLRSNVIEAVGTDSFAEKVIEYVSTALPIAKLIIPRLFWADVIHIFYGIVSKSVIQVKLPLLESSNLKETEKLSWDYPTRPYYVWTHLLASNYGWTIEYINNLKVEDVLALIQEILTEQHLEKEFQRSLSEVAYEYDKTTKKSKFIPMERPYWMLPKPKEIKKVKIPKSILPQGNIVDLNGIAAELERREHETKKA